MTPLRLVVAVVLGASALTGCQQQELGTTVAGKTCTVDLHATPRAVHPGDQVTLRRAPGCDQDDARRLEVSVSSTTQGPRPLGSAAIDADGAVTGVVVIPAGTAPGRVVLSLGEASDCSDTASCVGHPTSVTIRVR